MINKNLQTTKIKDINIKDEFKEKYVILTLKVNGNKEIKEFISSIENEEYVSYYIQYVKGVVYLITEKNKLSKNFNENYLVKSIDFDIDKNILLNLLLRSLPKINQNSLFSLTDNLNYLYDFKKVTVNKGKSDEFNYTEYYALGFEVDSNNILVMKAATYTDYDGLKQYFSKYSSKEYGKLQGRSVFYKDKALLVKFPNGNNELKAIVKKRVRDNEKKLIAAFNFDKNENKNKLEIFAKLKGEIKKVEKYFSIKFEEIVINYIENEKEEEFKNKNPKVKTKIVRVNDLDFTNEYIHLNNKLNIIDTTNSKYLSILFNLITSKGVSDISLSDYNEDKINLIITYSSEFYNGKDDPFNKYNSFNTQFINVENIDNDKIDLLLTEVKFEIEKLNKNLEKKESKIIASEENETEDRDKKTEKKTKKSPLCSLMINKINTLMQELLIKKNIMDKRINSLQEYSENGLLINLTLDNNKVLYRKGVLNEDYNLSFFDDEDLINNYELRIVEEKLSSIISNKKSEILLLSFGKKNEGSIFFENIYLLERSNEVLLNDIESIINKKEFVKLKISSGEVKRKDNGKLTRVSGGPSRTLLEPDKFDGHGLFGIMHIDKTDTIFQYAIGITENNPQSNVQKFPSFYNVYIINESNEMARMDFYKFFEHFYIRLNNAVTVPYLKKYLDEYYEYSYEENLGK